MGTTAAATARPFHDLEYRWDFGDPAGGATWANGSGANVNSKNAATGPLSAHVFETPGNYSVCLSVFDGVSTAQTGITIAVSDPNVVFAGSATLCVDSGGLPTAGMDGCPIGAAALNSSDFDAVINTTAGYGANYKRILFRRARTYVSSFQGALAADGPGLVGAYGTGTKPLITGASAKMMFGTAANTGNVNADFGDWRVVDLNFDGVSKVANAFEMIGPAKQLTFLRVEVRNTLIGLVHSKFFLDQINAGVPFTVPVWSEITMADSVIEDSGNYAFLGEANRFALLGSFLRGTDPIGGHLVRVSYTNSMVLSNNHLAGGSNGNSLTIRGFHPFPAGDNTIPPNAWTENVIVSDNRIDGGNSAWFFTIRRVNTGDDVRFRNILVERNWLVATPPTQNMLVTDAGELTIRNNLFQMTGGVSHDSVVLGRSSGTPASVSNNISVLNNSLYAGTATSGAYVLINISEGSAPTNLTVKNNLSYAPNVTGGNAVVLFSPGSGADISNNTSGASIQTGNPNFATTPPAAPLTWRPAAGSDAIDAGASVPVWSDFFMAPRTGTYDLGAVNP